MTMTNQQNSPNHYSQRYMHTEKMAKLKAANLAGGGSAMNINMGQ